MRRTSVATVLVAILLCSCASPTPQLTATPPVHQVAVQPTETSLPTTTPPPSAAPTIGRTDQACVRATAEISEGENPSWYVTSGPAAGCYDYDVGDFLDDIGLTWGEFGPGIAITFWTEWPVDADGRVVYPTPTPVPTPTPLRTYTVSGTVFFDYNGNGLRDAAEPPIEGVPVRVSGLTTTSGPDGSYSLAGVPAGSQQLYVDSPTQEPATAFRYLNRFLGWVDIPAYEMNGASVPAQHLADTDFQPIDQPLRITLSGDQSLNIALMQGFLTSPFLCGQDCPIGVWFDHDPREGFFLNYQGSADPHANPAGVAIGGDNHDGTDFDVPDGVPVLAMAPGTVIFSGGIETWHGTTMHVSVDHLNRSFATGSGHHGTLLVTVGQTVERGQIIALSGHSGATWPHVHLNVHRYEAGVDPPPTMDPFGARYDTEDAFARCSWWTVYNQIVCPR